MIGSILKVLAYRQAPKTTFAMLHPDAAFQMAKMRYDFHHAYAPRVAAIAAAAVALPMTCGRLISGCLGSWGAS